MHPVPHILVRAMTHSRSSRYFRPRAMSLENPKLLEALTIYEKLKRCQEECEEQEVDEEDRDRGGSREKEAPHNDHEDRRDSQDYLQTGGKPCCDHKLEASEEPLPLDPFSPSFEYVSARTSQGESIEDRAEFATYSRYKELNLKDSNYMYFSAMTGLIQSKTLESLCEEEEEMNYKELLNSKKYWLDIVAPTDRDLAILSSAFRVHDLTLRDIREGNTEEKMEMYNHYTFISLKLMKELGEDEDEGPKTEGQQKVTKEREERSPRPFGSKRRSRPYKGQANSEECEFLNIDIEDSTSTNSAYSSFRSSKSRSSTRSRKLPTQADFKESDADLNILMFSDFIITVHKKRWESVKEVLGFLSILFDYGGQTPPLPEWVLFSIFVELCQEAKNGVRRVTPQILGMRAAQVQEEDEHGRLGGVDVFKLSDVLRENFQYEFELHKICRFIKPKIQVLRAIQLKGRRRFPNVPAVVRFFANVGAEFDEMLDELDNLSRVVERSQDTFLALASVQQSVEANEMGEIMKRISEIAMIFLPVQAIAGFLGMNVKVPFQDEESTRSFWTVVLGSALIASFLFAMRRLILSRNRCSGLNAGNGNWSLRKVLPEFMGGRSNKKCDTDGSNLEEDALLRKKKAMGL